MPSESLSASLAGRANALNIVRMVLAVAVIVGHSWPLTGAMGAAGPRLADLGVNGFFALSGYLIAQSRSRLSLQHFLWNRAVRILPGFWVCLVVVAFGFAPLAAGLGGESWESSSAWHYVRSNAFLAINQWGIDSTLTSVPYAGAWNGSLWTLWYEAIAYLIAGLLLVATVRRVADVVLPALAIACATLVLMGHGPLLQSEPLALNGLRLFAFFAAGMAVWSVSGRLRASAAWTIPCLAFAAAGHFVLPDGWAMSVTSLPLAYGLIWLGGALGTSIGQRHDISYGMYIYAFPVQQSLAVVGAETLGVAAFALLSIAATVPLALASWFLVERPSMRLARGRPARRATPVHVPSVLVTTPKPT